MRNLKGVSPNLPDAELDALLVERNRRVLEAELARRNMAAFVSFTKRDYCHNRFSRAVCEALDLFLEDVRAGKRPILILQAPPQHGKSELVSRRFPAYAFGRFPFLRIAACSYASDLARDMNRDVQRIMLDDSYKAVFPDVWLNPKRVVSMENQALRNSDRFDIPGTTGYYVCTGVGGPLTGKSVDIGIIDDPIKNEAEARSAVVKKTIEGWYNTVFLTRLSKLSGQIIMATSWAVDDLAATVAKKNPRARVLKFPAIDEDGEALVPELHPLEKLLEVKALLSPGQWSALYQQTPIAEGGNIFQEDWIRRWDASTYPAVFRRGDCFMGHDLQGYGRLRLCRRAGMGAVRPQSLPARSDPQTHGLYGFESGRAGHARPLAAGDGGAHRRQGERPGGARRPARGGAGTDSGFAGRLEGRPRLRRDAAVGRGERVDSGRRRRMDAGFCGRARRVSGRGA